MSDNTPLPRGDLPKEVVTPEQELAQAVTYLASCRSYAETAGESAKELRKMLENTDLGLRLSFADEDFLSMIQAVKEAESTVRTLALDIHAETTEHRPHDAVLVKHYQVPVIKDEEALFHHVRIYTPQCVKLDKREVAKVAKVITLPGVVMDDVYRATIQRDLSTWLPVISQDELDYRASIEADAQYGTAVTLVPLDEGGWGIPQEAEDAIE